MFSKIKAVISKAVKSVAETAISAKNKTVSFIKNLGIKTAKFIKLNIVETFRLAVVAVKFVKNFFSKSLAIGGVKHAIESLVHKTEDYKDKNPAAFKKLAVLCSGLCVALSCIFATVFFNFNTMAVSVITNGQVVGYVSDASELDSIMSGVSALLVDENDTDKIDTIKFGLAMVPKSSIKKGADLAMSVLSAQDDITAAVGLYVDGKLVTSASSEQIIKEALERRKAKYVTKDTELVSILEKIELKTVYCSDKNKVSDKNAVELISSEDKLDLSVQTKVYSTTVKTLSHETVIKEDSGKVVGYNRVSVRGKDGSAEVSEMITKVNGKVVETLVIDENIIDTPINQVIVKGTSTNGMNTVQKTLASKGISFLWPIAATENMYVSSHWGDGRNHGGIDITGDYGTPIYASYEGTVAFAGWSGEYGYLIVINHRGGYQTAYAHMSSIYVKAGQTVKSGEVIAGCGQTGIATGDHVHFEVRIGGTRVNPAPYLGLGY